MEQLLFKPILNYIKSLVVLKILLSLHHNNKQIGIMKEKNCLPDGLETIQDKIEYIKACYNIIGENGNLFDWLINELLNKKDIKKELIKLLYDNSVEERSSTGTTGEIIIYGPFYDLADEIINLL